MASIPNAEVILAIDIGSTNTRASLFDVIDGRYRLVATSESQSTANAPLYDISEGVRLALDRVQAITGRRLMDESEMLITPTTGFGGGVDLFVASVSAGPKVKTILAGLMPGVSLASARRLAESSYLDVVGEISIIDSQEIESLVDMVLSNRPDLIVAVGGTDNGASNPLFQMLEILKLAIGLLPEGMRPQVVFAGNRSLGALVTDQLSDRTQVALMPNVRPSLEIEDLSPSRLQLAETIFNIRAGRIAGYQELKQWSGGSLLPTAEAFGRLVRYLSKVYDPDKGVLGIDIGASHTTVAGAFAGQLNLSVNSELGMGGSILGSAEDGSVKAVLRWLPIEASESQVKDYMYMKSVHPRSVPITADDLQYEFAFARQVIRRALYKARNSWPEGKGNRSQLTLPPVEPILAAGAVLARAPHPYETALILLDGLQPVGVTTLVLDPYSLASALGSAAGPLPVATVQLLEAGVLVSLGTVVSPVGKGRLGLPVLSYRLDREDGTTPITGEIEFGQISVLPLPAGRHARLTITPERGFDIGFGASGRTVTLRVSGGVVGVIIDARGRPLALPGDRGRQMELAQKWLWEIGKVEQ